MSDHFDTPTAKEDPRINLCDFALTDDAVDVVLSLMTHTDLGDGVAPDRSRIRAEFPYFGEPYARNGESQY